MTGRNEDPNQIKKKSIHNLSLKEKIQFYFDDLETSIGKLVDLSIIFLILILCITFVLSTYEKNYPKSFADTIDYIEYTIIGIFTVEFLLRLWVAENKLKFLLNIYTIIDILAILPTLFTLSNLEFVRIFRVLRVFRVLRFLRYLRDENFFFGKIRDNELIIVRIIFTLLAILFVSSGFIYFQEHDAVDSKIKTFFDAVYFSVVTMTTVGFGDVVPVTEGGKIITLMMIISGVIFLPWQIGTLIKKFALSLNKINVVCKKCGLKQHDRDAVHCKACGNIIYQVYESEEV